MRVLFSAAEIAARVDALAGEIAHHLSRIRHCRRRFLLQTSSARWTGPARPGIEFMRLSSYGLAKENAGVVHLLGDIPTGHAGRPVLLVDDIVDTGRAIARAAAQLSQRVTGDLWTCAFLYKPQRREIAVAIDFVGFSIGDVFAVVRY